MLATEWPYLGPVYLHFLNRELRRSVGRSTYPDKEPALLFATAATTATLFAPLSAVIEDYGNASASQIDVIRTLVEAGTLQLVSDSASLSDFVEAKRRLYKFDSGRYDSYFSNFEPPGWLEPTVYKEASATAALEIAIFRSLETPAENQLGSLTYTNASNIEQTIRSRSDRGITMSLFVGKLTGRNLGFVGRFISSEYVEHYLSYISADIITGLPGLQFFDQLTTNFPCMDYHLWRVLFSCIRADELLYGRKSDSHRQLSHINGMMALRGGQAHVALVSDAQQLITSLAVQKFVENGGREWSLRGGIESRLRSCSSKYAFSDLPWSGGPTVDSMYAAVERLGMIQSGLTVADRESLMSNYPELEKKDDSMTTEEPFVFISYVREDLNRIDRLCKYLQSRGLRVWQDRASLVPGQRWKDAIRRAITSRSCAFVACFSQSYAAKGKSYMNEELTLAIEEIRRRPHDRSWFIPALLDDMGVPERDIGGGEVLGDIQQVDLFSDWSAGCEVLAQALLNVTGAF